MRSTCRVSGGSFWARALSPVLNPKGSWLRWLQEAYRGGRLEQPESGTIRVLATSALRPDEVSLAKASETKAAPR
jgi:hypothetical protein